MSELKPCRRCPFCGGEMVESGLPDTFICTECGSHSDRPVPELPKGYREDNVGLWCEGSGYVAELDYEGRIIPGPPIHPRHFPALAIWLQRKNK